MIVKFLGAGSGAGQEKIQHNFYGAYFDTFAVNTGIDQFFVDKTSFVNDFSVTDGKSYDIVQVNGNNSY
jgi:hypothetical protein